MDEYCIRKTGIKGLLELGRLEPFPLDDVLDHKRITGEIPNDFRLEGLFKFINLSAVCAEYPHYANSFSGDGSRKSANPSVYKGCGFNKNKKAGHSVKDIQELVNPLVRERKDDRSREV